MAQETGTLTLYREKTLFFDGAHPGPDLEPYAKLAIRANRIACKLTNDKKEAHLVVRGQNIPSTLRLAGLVIDAFKSDPSCLTPELAMRWQKMTENILSDFDRVYAPDSWFSIYSNGVKLYSSSPEKAPALDLVEAEAKGAEITELLLKRLAPRLTDARQIRLRHDSRAAVVMNENSDGVRCAVIERRRGKDAAFSFHVQNPPKKRIRMSPVLFMAADLFEMQNLYALAERVKKVLSGEIPKTEIPISLDQVDAMQTRNLQLASLARVFHESHTVRYRPAPPSYLPIAARQS
jgi:hypothetical protein